MTIDVADLRKRAERTFPQVYPSELTELLDAYEERDRLRAALSDIAYDTSSSVPLEQWPVDHYRDMMSRCIGIAARALEGRE